MKSPARSTRIEKPQLKSGGGTLLGIFIGLVIGILIAFGVVYYLNKANLPFQDKYEGASKPAPVGSNGPAAPLALPGKPGVPGTGEKPRFDFYGILEGKPASTAPAVVKTPVTPPAIPTTEAKPADLLYLQLGAFQKAGDADNLKAKLALSGFDAAVQEVDIPNKGTMHRVRVGPFHSADEMNRARGQLSQTGMEGTVIKQKE